MEYTDYSNPAGGVGFGVYNNVGIMKAHFDNFAVTGDDIPSNIKSVSPKAKVAVTWGQMKIYQ